MGYTPPLIRICKFESYCVHSPQDGAPIIGGLKIVIKSILKRIQTPL